METDLFIECFTAPHIALAVCCGLMLTVYTTLVLGLGAKLSPVRTYSTPLRHWVCPIPSVKLGIAWRGCGSQVLRLKRVGGSLASVEFEWRRPWDYSRDSKPEAWALHPLARLPPPRNAAPPGILSADIVLKLINVAVAKLLSSHPVIIASTVIATGAYLTGSAAHARRWDASPRWAATHYTCTHPLLRHRSAVPYMLSSVD